MGICKSKQNLNNLQGEVSGDMISKIKNVPFNLITK